MGNEGKKVKVYYTGTLDDGTKFDSSYDRNEPLEFTCMAGQMIPGFDKAVADMAIGETRNVRLEPADAYGEYDEQGVQTIEYEHIPGAKQLNVGDRVMLSNSSGQRFPARVTSKNDSSITFDLNHELAGKALNFEITLLEAE
ncbi:MAG: FKBP-type peptidyl-prolyl cis-trans isomerase [Coriobacteriales bacterium]|jgi:FKBP-type peptidyl-prolyl cis-trans isomerase 2